MNKALVAKSYQELEQISEPYTINGKQYVKVRMKNGVPKVVRAYTESEYKRYNPEVKIIQPAKSRRDVLGFGEAGYIWIFKGDTYSSLDWFKISPCRYTDVWGWYLPSNIEMPSPLPVGIEPIQLRWDEVSTDGQLLNKNAIQKIVEEKIYDAGTSQWVGEVGKRYEFTLTCIKMIESANQYGITYINSLIDKDNNIFVWITASHALEPETTYKLNGTIKSHDVYRNNHQNTLTRCRIIETL